MSTSDGSRPPSVPIWVILGPAVAGSGTPPARPSAGQESGQQVVPAPVGSPVTGSGAGAGTTAEHSGRVRGFAAGTILTSVLVRPSELTTVESATYRPRLRKRSLPTL